MKKTLLLLIFLLTTVTFTFAQSGRNEVAQNMSVNPPAFSKVVASPNPLVDKTTITFTATKREKMEFIVKNLLGRTVYKEVLYTEVGTNRIPFSKDDLKSGVYLYTLKTSDQSVSKRIIIK
ncbi:T9SS type A sorting domain-containing protein [Aureivirga sp. CE67]|uniref:T9SS type A sorting domain-containing protein n=1 Tax=Aureivirga sp. CE67 TaxID=1788983 RepID=UPI0018CA3CE8|nr:T9SS type A sorting domain-containing protein [Aureivirga sp. CE67]